MKLLELLILARSLLKKIDAEDVRPNTNLMLILTPIKSLVKDIC